MKVALVNPEIPQNTGSIARTCAATKTDLHLIGKLGFEINEKRVRRAGLDYWPYVSLIHDESWEDFANDNSDSKFWYLSKFAENNYYDADFQKNDILVFGSETKGLGKEFLEKIPKERLLRIPMPETNVRSLNLSNAVSIVLYEALKKSKSI